MAPTPKLIVLSEQLRGQTFELTEDVHTIGRNEDQNICIVDATVSSRHCELVKNDDGLYTARDTGSTNGTRINGTRIEEQKLVNSDILQVGGVELLFDCDDKSPTSVLRTKTKIKIEDTMQINQTMQNKSPFASGKGENPLVKKVFIGAIAVLALAVVIVGVLFLIDMLGGAG